MTNAVMLMASYACTLRARHYGRRAAFKSQFGDHKRTRVPGRHAPAPVRASADGAEAAVALTQQAIAFAAVVGAEGAFRGLTMQPADKGRPSVPTTVGGTATTIAAVALVQQGPPVSAAGYGLGLAAAVFLFAYYLQRARDTVNGEEFPGNKAWPAVMALLAFFILSAFLQALLPAMGI